MPKFSENNKVQEVVSLIIDTGIEVSSWYQLVPTMQWQHASRWITICGTMSAFSCAVVYEIYKSGRDGNPSINRDFFKAVEDSLFRAYEQDSKLCMAPVRSCLPMAAECQEFCSKFGITEDTRVTMSMISGIIFPHRIRQGQRDWAAGFTSNSVHAPAEFAAMRLAADLAGIVTPASLVGQMARDLGIMYYGSTLPPLTDFFSKYQASS